MGLGGKKESEKKGRRLNGTKGGKRVKKRRKAIKNENKRKRI